MEYTVTNPYIAAPIPTSEPKAPYANSFTILKASAIPAIGTNIAPITVNIVPNVGIITLTRVVPILANESPNMAINSFIPFPIKSDIPTKPLCNFC